MKEIIFIANHKPPLADGLYSLTLKHTLNYGQGNTAVNSKTYGFSIAGERFSIKSNLISKLFPPANAAGCFDNVLPHVVFNRRTLPWQRLVDDTKPYSSWLAVLLFTVDTAPAPVSGTLADLYPDTAPDGNGKLPQGIYSYGSVRDNEDYFLEYGESAGDGCVYIDISRDQFAALAPSLNDLAWNAHARTLKDGDTGISTDYAIVVGNRLPWPGKTCIAHLVSLEGFGAQLPQDDGSYPASPAWTYIRLISLQSWSFCVSAPGASFSNILQGLNGGTDTSVKERGDSQLRLPAGYIPQSAGVKAAASPFNSGYSVLAGADGAAGKTAWYRGPFVPSIITPLPADITWTPVSLPANAAPALVVTVSAIPADDVSLAAAWQLGRLLALADSNFATAQVSWKRDVRSALNLKLGQGNGVKRGSRVNYAEQMRDVIADAGKITAQLGATLTVTPQDGQLTIPQQLVDWLGRLALLENVPVSYLVADSQMLPPESLKFFNTDPRWLACLLDGAWSLERQPASQWALDTAYQPWRQIRDGTLKTSFAPQLTCWPISGMVLNSQIIPGYWPGIIFEPNPADTGNATNTLREDNPGAGTLLMLFDRELTSLRMSHPPEGIHFGFDMGEAGVISKMTKYVNIENTVYPAPPPGPLPDSGTPAPAAYTLTAIPQRGPGMINMDKLAAAIAAQLQITDSSKFTAAEFALELVEGIAAATFTLPGKV